MPIRWPGGKNSITRTVTWFGLIGFINTFAVLVLGELVARVPISIERLVNWDYITIVLCPPSFGLMAIEHPHSLTYVAGIWLIIALGNVVVYGVVGLFVGVVWKVATRAKGRSQVT